mmetsp:Transcript_6830/g.15608  ORF Transcript_6830/g.15608 Transcript_6830/m.15608 type:complete len:1626 (-) Transcript_6830:1186-6063(-)
MTQSPAQILAYCLSFSTLHNQLNITMSDSQQMEDETSMPSLDNDSLDNDNNDDGADKLSSPQPFSPPAFQSRQEGNNMDSDGSATPPPRRTGRRRRKSKRVQPSAAQDAAMSAAAASVPSSESIDEANEFKPDEQADNDDGLIKETVEPATATVSSPSPPNEPPLTRTRTPSPVAFALAIAANESRASLGSSPSPVQVVSTSTISAPQAPPPITRDSTPPSSKIPEMPPKKNALFSQWAEKTRGSSPLVPGRKSAGGEPGVKYTGKRWSPPKKLAAGGTPPLIPPKAPSSPSAGVRGTPPSTPPSATNSPKKLNYAPPPPSRSKTPSPTHSRGSQVSLSKVKLSPPRPSKLSKIDNKNSPTTRRPTLSKIDNMEKELDDLKELKQQLQIATAAAGSGKLSSSFKKVEGEKIHVDISRLKEDLDLELEQSPEKEQQLDGRSSRRKGHNPMMSYWQQSTERADPLKPNEKVPFSGIGYGGSSQSGGSAATSRAGSPAHGKGIGIDGSDNAAATDERNTRDSAEYAAAVAEFGAGATLTAAVISSNVSNNVEETSVRSASDDSGGDFKSPLPTASAGGGMARPIIEGEARDTPRLPTPPLGKPPPPSRKGSTPEEELDDAMGGDLAMDFRALVEILVKQVMPGEINHIDELIQEYAGREGELLTTLSAMKENEELLSRSVSESDRSLSTHDDGSPPKAGAQNKVYVTTLPTVLSSDDVYEASPRAIDTDRSASPVEIHSDNNSTKKRKSMTQHFKDITRMAGPAAATTAAAVAVTATANDDGISNDSTEHRSNIINNLKNVGCDVDNVESSNNGDVESGLLYVPVANDTDQANDNKSKIEIEGERRNRKHLITISVIVLLLLAGAATALGLVYGGNSNDDKSPSGSNEEDCEFNARTDDFLDTATGTLSGGTQVPTKSPTSKPTTSNSTTSTTDGNENGENNDGYDPNAALTACNTLPTNIQELGIRAIEGNYPKVAIDGDQAIVASGGGYVAFFKLDPTSNTWTRTELFSTTNVAGEIKSVAISGDTAVIGTPRASTDFSANREEPLITGAIYIYRKNEAGDWRQLRGAYIPDEYQRAANEQYAEAHFGTSVDIDGDLIVVGAPEENENEGSITVFHLEKGRDGEDGDWVQVERIVAPNLCGGPFVGYAVQVHRDVIASSADCNKNILLYQVERSTENDEVSGLTSFQQLEYVDPKYGAVSSISMSGDNLVYSTVMGGLFVYQRQDSDDYERTQEMSFPIDVALFEYPLVMDANMMALSVVNEIYMYTQNPSSKEWERESLVINNSGDYAGYVGASVALSDGHLLLASKREVTAHDFTECASRSASPTPIPNGPSPTPNPTPGPTTPLATTPAPTPNPTPSPTPNPTALPTPNPTIRITAPPTVSLRPLPSSSCYNLDVDVTLDQYASDTRWEIIPQGQSGAVATSPPYDASLAFTPTDTESVCLPEGTYDFTIYDVYGDGICCYWGEGSYKLAFDDNVVAEGGSFGLNETKTFSTPGFVPETSTTPPSTPDPPNPSPTPPECYDVNVNLNFDTYPQDESWDISQDGVIVASSPPYASGLTQDAQELCLPPGDYVFTIYDVYADGMCCKWGEGSYSVTTINEEVIGGGAEFEASESTSFTLPTAAMS